MLSFPPRIVESHITIRRCFNTGRPVETASRRIQGLAGSTVELRIRVDKPVVAAVLSFSSSTSRIDLPAQIAQNGLQCTLPGQANQPWTLTTAGTYGWVLTDRAGMNVTVDDNTEVDVIPDLPPVVSLESPDAEGAFTARAVVSVRALVKDDLAIQQVEFASGERTHVLAKYNLPTVAERGLREESGRPQLVEYAWDLSTLPDLVPGMTVPFTVIADDFLPQSSAPGSGTIRILSDAEFQRRIDEAQTTLAQKLNEALRLQRILQGQTGSLVAQLKSSPQLSPADEVIWPGLDPGQRRVANMLTGESGAQHLVEQF